MITTITIVLLSSPCALLLESSPWQLRGLSLSIGAAPQPALLRARSFPHRLVSFPSLGGLSLIPLLRPHLAFSRSFSCADLRLDVICSLWSLPRPAEGARSVLLGALLSRSAFGFEVAVLEKTKAKAKGRESL